jgi:hypothetical protein
VGNIETQSLTGLLDNKKLNWISLQYNNRTGLYAIQQLDYSISHSNTIIRMGYFEIKNLARLCGNI